MRKPDEKHQKVGRMFGLNLNIRVLLLKFINMIQKNAILLFVGKMTGKIAPLKL